MATEAPAGPRTGKWKTKALLDAGAMVDHYKIIRRIGLGGMGEVYLARDLRLGRPVAIKLMSVFESALVEQFMLEAQATARLNHPHIVTVYDIGEIAGSPYLALEYLEGRTLADRRREHSFGIGELLRTGLAIADALAAAHREGILHRDLKPSNILFPKDGRLRVVDFGLAKMLVSSELAQTDPLMDALPEVTAPTVANPAPLVPPPRPAVPDVDGATVATDDEPPTELVPATRVDPSLFDDGEPRTAHSVYRTGIAFAGTPPYMAPEQWVQIDTRATDIWALGIILYELVCGERPYAGPDDVLRYLICSPDPVPMPPAFRDIPGELAACIMSCLKKRPEERPSAEEVIALLEPMVQRGRLPTSVEGNPFRGLLAFTEQHADLFYGRDDEITAFLERLHGDVIVPVVGPSGAGKSSFVRAGVIPRLREQGKWHILRFRPGNQPIDTLADRLLAGDSTGSVVTAHGSTRDSRTQRLPRRGTADASDARELARELRETPGRLAVALGELAERTGSRVLLLVDQLEELYTLVEDEGEREAFMDAITSAADDPLEPVRVVFTLRDDFVGRVAVGRRAREVLGRVALLGPPGPEALRQTLLGPLAATGYGFDDPALPDEMIRAVQGEPASLPLLQFAMRLLWERRDVQRKLLLRAEHDAIGGVAGALAAHADVVIESLDPERIRLARDLLLRLVTSEGTRRVVPRPRLLDGLGPEAGEVLDRLIEARLLAVRRGHGPEEDARVELAHESLIVAWQRLAWWLEDSREERRAVGELSQAAELWQRRGRREDELWQGDALAEAQRTLGRVAPPLVPEVARAFVAAGLERHTRGARRRRRTRIIATAALVLVALGSLEAAWLLARKERAARAAEERAETERAQVLVESARAAYARRDPLQARSKVRSALEIRDSAAGRALWGQLGREPLIWTKSVSAHVYQTRFSPDGKTLAVAAQSKLVYLLDTTTLEARVLQGHGDQVLSVAFAPDGKQLASASWNGEIFLWDLATERSLPLTRDGGEFTKIAYSPDGRRLYAVGRDGGLRSWELAGDQVVRAVQVGKLASASFARDASAVGFTTGGEDAAVWRLPDFTAVRTFHRDGSRTSAVAVAPGGRLLAWGEQDGAVRVWSSETGKEVSSFHGHNGKVTGLGFDPTGARLASISMDLTLRMWDLESGRELFAISGTGTFANGIEFDAAGERMTTGGLDISMWAADGAGTRPATGHQSAIYGLAFTPDGKTLATADIEGVIRVWDVATGTARCTFRGHEGEMRAAAINPRGDLLATGGWDRIIRLWSLPSCAPAGVLEGHERRVFDLSFSPDGDWLLSAAEDDTARLWRVATRSNEVTLRGHTGAVSRAAFSPDGSQIATAGWDGAVWLWTRDGKGRQIYRGEQQLDGIAYSPDATRLAIAGADGVARLWDGTSWREVSRFAGRYYDLAYHPDGRRLLLAASDRTAHVVDLETGKRSTLSGHHGEVNSIAVDPTGAVIATASDDWTVRTWRADSGQPLWHSVGLIGDETFGQRGWLKAGERTTTPGRAAWRQAIEQRARSAAASGERLCMTTWQGRLEVWDRSSDRRLYERRGAGRVIAGPGGCLTLEGESAELHTPTGTLIIASGATAIASDPDGWLVADGDRVVVFEPAGAERVRFPGGVGVTSLVRSSGALVLGYRDGILERRQNGRSLLFDETPASRVTALARGPVPGTVLAGFANGAVGMWDLESGKRLESMQLHGLVDSVAVEGGRLHAATDLGDHAAYDLAVFRADYCPLLRRIWREVPTQWGAGVPQARPPPADHRCAGQ
ncbi:MAG TPA: protein kinase [Kofleriaceae bacterium]